MHWNLSFFLSHILIRTLDPPPISLHPSLPWALPCRHHLLACRPRLPGVSTESLVLKKKKNEGELPIENKKNASTHITRQRARARERLRGRERVSYEKSSDWLVDDEKALHSSSIICRPHTQAAVSGAELAKLSPNGSRI